MAFLARKRMEILLNMLNYKYMTIMEPGHTASTLEIAHFKDPQYSRLPILTAAELLANMKFFTVKQFEESPDPKIKILKYLVLAATPNDASKHGQMEIYTDASSGIPKLRYRVYPEAVVNKIHPVWGIFSSYLKRFINEGRPFEMSHADQHTVRICLPKDLRNDKSKKPGDIVGLAFHPPDNPESKVLEGRIDFLKLPPPTAFRPSAELV